MSDNNYLATPQDKSRSNFGRIEVVPEILVAIAERTSLNTKGMIRFADISTPRTRKQNHITRAKGIELTMHDEGIQLDLYVVLDAMTDLMETARKLQTTIVEGIDRMVGTPVVAVNVHVEDVDYPEAT